MPFVYILHSEKLNKYYVGAYLDLERRLKEHNIGHSKFTSTGLPWVLKYKELFGTLQEAKKREATIKKMKSKKYIEGLIGCFRSLYAAKCRYKSMVLADYRHSIYRQMYLKKYSFGEL